MKKFVKLSLAAAVASTGFVSANAGALEEAVKNTTIGGYATYRYDDRTLDNDGTAGYNNDATNNHKIVVALTSKVNDDVSYTYAGAVITSENATSDGSGVDYMDGNMHSVYSFFTYTGLDNVTVNIGQQTIDTPQTDTYDDITGTQEGTGITAATSFAGINVTAGFMNSTNLGDDKFGSFTASGSTGYATLNDTQKKALNTEIDNAISSADLYVVQANTKLGPIAVDANYLKLKDVADSFTVGASTSFALDNGIKISPYARYTSFEMDKEVVDTLGVNKDNSLWFVGAKVKAGAISGNVSYSETDQDGGLVAADNDAVAANQGWGTVINGIADAELIKLNVAYALSPKYSIALNHNMQEVVDVETDETYGQLTWKLSKNFSAYTRYGVVEQENGDKDQRGRIHMTYKF